MARGANIPASTPACLQELEERVANVRERGRILTDFLYSMGNGNATPSPRGRRQQSSPRFTMSRGTMSPGNGAGTARPPSVPGRLMSLLGTRGTSASPPHGQSHTNVAGDAADDPRQRLSPPLTRTSDYVEHRMPGQRASQRAREEEDQLAAARLASEEEDRTALTLASEDERQLAAAIQASLTESDEAGDMARQSARSRPSTAWESPSVARPSSHSTSTSLGENYVDFPAALAGGGDVSPRHVNNGYV